MSARYPKMSGGLIGADELRTLVGSGEVDTITLAVPDIGGRLVGKRHHAPVFVDHLLAGGPTEACAYLLATDTEMRPLPGFELASWQTGYGDIRLVPDLSTLRRLPWHRGQALLLADTHQTNGQPLPVAPRQVLHDQIARLAGLGLSAKAGLETEFTVYQGQDKQAQQRLAALSGRNLDYALVVPLAVREYLNELQDALTESGLPLEALKTEAAPGQIEVTFRYGDALTAADNHAVFKHIVKTITPWTENHATFMAAPQTGIGNGLHLHLSLWDKQDPVLPAGDGGLSATGSQAVAGLLHVLPQVMPLLLPTPNSYKRLRPHSFAPTRTAWGWDNRTAAVRVTGHGSGLHLEIRIPGADANPYLVLAAALAACRHGIQHQLQPPPATTGNAYTSTEPPLPATLDAALSVFQDSTAAAELLGKEVVAHYATAARLECDEAAIRVTDIERARGFTEA